MTSNRPYLLRALYQWVLDNQCTPYVLIDASLPGVMVPASTVKDGQVVLNVAPHAVSHLDLGDDLLSFNARFSGVSQRIRVPVGAVLALYARENGDGMMFPPEVAESADRVDEDLTLVENETLEPAEVIPLRPRNHLKVVK